VRARAHRWQEECLLLQEEMRCILAYFKWDVSRWKSLAEDLPIIRVGNHGDQLSAIEKLVDKEHRLLIAGKRAYALHQAEIRDALRKHCEMKWIGLGDSLLVMKEGSAWSMVEGLSE